MKNIFENKKKYEFCIVNFNEIIFFTLLFLLVYFIMYIGYSVNPENMSYTTFKVINSLLFIIITAMCLFDCFKFIKIIKVISPYQYKIGIKTSYRFLIVKTNFINFITGYYDFELKKFTLSQNQDSVIKNEDDAIQIYENILEYYTYNSKSIREKTLKK